MFCFSEYRRIAEKSQTGKFLNLSNRNKRDHKILDVNPLLISSEFNECCFFGKDLSADLS